jgi:hypothetical protein
LNLKIRPRGNLGLRIDTEEFVLHISPLKGVQIVSPGFTLGMLIIASCPEGAPEAGVAELNPYERLFILAPLSGRVFAGRLPRLMVTGPAWIKV